MNELTQALEKVIRIFTTEITITQDSRTGDVFIRPKFSDHIIKCEATEKGWEVINTYLNVSYDTHSDPNDTAIEVAWELTEILSRQALGIS